MRKNDGPQPGDADGVRPLKSRNSTVRDIDRCSSFGPGQDGRHCACNDHRNGEIVTRLPCLCIVSDWLSPTRGTCGRSHVLHQSKWRNSSHYRLDCVSFEFESRLRQIVGAIDELRWVCRHPHPKLLRVEGRMVRHQLQPMGNADQIICVLLIIWLLNEGLDPVSSKQVRSGWNLIHRELG